MVYIAKDTESVPGEKLFWEQLSPKSALIVGLVVGIMTLCTIGFIILLYLKLA